MVFQSSVETCSLEIAEIRSLASVGPFEGGPTEANLRGGILQLRRSRIHCLVAHRLHFVLLLLMSVHGVLAEPGPISYSRDVRPILSKNCFACHGPDESKMKGKTRLDVSGKANLDELISRIRSTDSDEIMPPPEANKVLSQDDIAVLEKWISEGAVYEKHWAFVLPVQEGVPKGEHPVDYFVDKRLRAEGLARSFEADALTRLRRVTLDLVGLPPTSQQVETFASDPSPEAYARIVDDLLASQRYGERWARRWLDLARYADTNGYEKDRDRSIWPYRDWVIESINDGMPFDQFTIEQLAGDMLPEATKAQLIATGFHRNTMLNEEGGIDPLEFRFHAMTDRVATTGTTWLGLTTGCAQCHTHKYDPITHRDYFGLMAYLNNVDEPKFFIPDSETQGKNARRSKKAEGLIEALPSKWPEDALPLEEVFDQWIENERANVVNWQTLVPTGMSANYPYLTQEEDGVIFAAGDTSKHDIYTLEFAASDQEITTFRLEALPDARLPGDGPGMTYYEGTEGDFFLTEFVLEDSDGIGRSFAGASETYGKNRFGSSRVAAELATDGDLQSGWSVSGAEGSRHVAVFHLKEPLAAGSPFTLTMHFGRHYASSLGKFRLSAATVSEFVVASVLSPEESVAIMGESPDANTLVRKVFLMRTPELKDARAEILKLQRPNKGTSTLVMRERPLGQTRPTFLHNRGEFTQPTERVSPRLPEALIAENMPQPSDRLEFARWLVSRENPLTARVVVNRQWAAFFGTGLVRTLDDFGMQGELPSHPALLDYLAVEFMESGWSMKALHRLMVTSATYQQSSQIPEPSTKERDRRLLRVFSRTRLEAEIIRDASLAASGLLQTEMYGPPVRPPQPDSAQGANYKRSTWKASEGADRFRRSLYTYQNRTAPFAMFTTFDASSGEACVAKRDVSNTPLQALTLMNDPMFVEIAVAYGKRMASVEGEVSVKIVKGFRWLLTRLPEPDEVRLLKEFHEKHDDWTALARVILSLDEAITKN